MLNYSVPLCLKRECGRTQANYHEMMAHVPVLALLAARPATADGQLRALVLGGGDGGAIPPMFFFVGRITHETYRGSAVLTRTDPTGVAARLLEHRAVGLVTLVEIDPAVIAACRRFFDCPGPPGAFRWPQRCLRVP